ncbi:MAG: T9SS type A sorting domain-containing protein [Candidatus Latescibacteria bacterium]|nr:T9SS type A sorting domain-containing protein [Candidatus Latescibacterota bacterium]NIO29067.1 T9SS type A sorting domain-containing protein [Candidatus Latescibacterota bacterium]NIO56692.1 T9SS type A sorting domain-containing protein [Candidatus Latescibacterota bacterium]NIT02275.1 T9SS type A sorting domain-containing protein [Candidatus Latescibacterota bacterium]NIT39160.1 T9SS type A sorting domain-containing protein [Candidatus Latescibacterota bacterium]
MNVNCVSRFISIACIIGCIIFFAAFGTTSLADTEFAFITTTDFSSGSASVIWLDGSYTVEKNVVSLHSDAVARYYDGLIYAVNRLGADNIHVLDPNNNFATVLQFSVGNGSNPSDIAFVSKTKAYVSRYDSTHIWVVNPSTGAKIGSIDLSSLADADGLPEMDRLCIFEKHLFITIQRLDRNNYWVPVGTSYIAVVDVDADTLVDTDPVTPGKQSIPLAGTNPFSDLKINPYKGTLYVSCVGYWGIQDCGIEMVDPGAFHTLGYTLTEASSGGDINDMEIVAPDKGYAIITNASFHNILISFDQETGIVTDTLYAPGDYVLHDIEKAPTGELFLADGTLTNPGVRVYDIATNMQVLPGPIDVGLLPFDITFSVNIPSGMAINPPFVASMGQNFPNPFNPSTTIPFTLAKEITVKLSIYDVTGRHVRTILNERRPAGDHLVHWDGRDEASRILPSGVYFARLEADDFIATRKLLLLK